MAEVKAFAAQTGQSDQLQDKLDYLAGFGGDPKNVRCTLYSDFAPHSFTFVIEKHGNGDWHTLFNGGLIYHGPHDGHGNGAGPAYAVTAGPVQGWAIHT